MAVHRSHDQPRPQVARADELPAGTPAPARPAPRRDQSGRLLPGPGTSALAAAAGRARGDARKLARLLGFAELPEDHGFARYHRLAREWRDEHMAELAATVGGGTVGPGPASIVATAALQLAASRFVYDQAIDHGGAAKLFSEASRLADASRQNLLAAHELTAKEAVARAEVADPVPDFGALAPAPMPRTAKGGRS
jgi:hypothetical protein